MDAREFLIDEIHALLRRNLWKVLDDRLAWESVNFFRTCLLRFQQGDQSGWNDFMTWLHTHRGSCQLTNTIRSLLEKSGRLEFDDCRELWILQPLPEGVTAFHEDDERKFLACMARADEHVHPPNQTPQQVRDSRTSIRYIESKPGLTGVGRIGRVLGSKTGKTLYYRGQRFQSLKGWGYKANYRCLESGMWYWISNCRLDGRDTLYPGTVYIDEDVRAEYWSNIRKKPELIDQTSFRSVGKYNKREPR